MVDIKNLKLNFQSPPLNKKKKKKCHKGKKVKEYNNEKNLVKKKRNLQDGLARFSEMGTLMKQQGSGVQIL